MPICTYCGVESESVKQCPHCLAYYCDQHIETTAHDCPLVPIQNPYSLNAGNQLVQPDELLNSPNAEEQQYSYTQPVYGGAPRPEEYYSQTSQYNVSSSGIQPMESEQDTYIFTDGSYIWYKKSNDVPDDAFNPESGVVIPGILWPKKSELIHFLIASVLLFILAATGFIQSYQTAPYLSAQDVFITVVILSLLYLSAFLGHEFAHRQIAVHFGLQTKFRLFKMGVVLTIVCIFLPVKMALPGAVVVLGLEKISRETGLCKAGGPISNLIMGSILLGVAFIPVIRFPYNFLFLQGASFNFMLGSFNLLPIGILDGQNIWKWKPKVWIILFILLVSSFMLVLYLLNNQCVFLSFFYRGTSIPWQDAVPNC